MNAKTIALAAGIAVLVAVAALLLQPGAPAAPPAADIASELSSVEALLNATELPAAPEVNESVAENF